MIVDKYKVPVQSLIDHIKSAMDVDPLAKEMAEELLKNSEPVEPERDGLYVMVWRCGECGTVVRVDGINERCDYCRKCGRKVLWND